MYRFYYSHSTGGDVLYCLIDPSSYPDEVRKKGDVASLYFQGRRIGINFLNISKKVKIKADGMIPSLSPRLLEIVNHMLINALEEPLPSLEKSLFAIAEVISTEEHPLDEKKKIVHLSLGDSTLDTVSRYQNVIKGAKVVVALDGCIKADGTVFSSHSERNIPIDCEICSSLDLRLGSEEKAAFIALGAPGDDFFA